MTTVDFFFSFRSPYSYLAAPRVFTLPERYAVAVRLRGVIPMAMRGQKVPRAKQLHTLRDVKREAVRLGMPFGPVHDPIGAGAVRCLLVAEHAVDVGRERAFVLEASRAIWSRGANVARDRPLRAICEAAGLDWGACRESLRDPVLRQGARARVDANTDELVARGHWGVPVLDFRGELFWGQDRIEDLELVLADAGLARGKAA